MGEPKNLRVIREIVKSVSIPVQVGGGIRDIGTVKNYIEDIGVERVILGTLVFHNPDLLKEICEAFPGRAAVGVDVKGGKIAVKGWKELIHTDFESVVKTLKDSGVSILICTDVGRDGTMGGVNLEWVEGFLKKVDLPVIASGGIASIEDIESLSRLQNLGLIGAIVGRAIYTGAINLEEAIRRFS